MRSRVLLPLLVAVLVLGCKKAEQAVVTTTVVSETVAAAPPPAAAPTSPASVPAPTPTPVAPTTGVIASQETNWKGVVAEVTEFRRKGNTLTAKVRLTNRGAENIEPDVTYSEVYLIDTGGGKKYEVLKDEKNSYIAALKSGWNNRWYGTIKPTESYTLWMKFPAPGPEVKAITLQIPNTAPFEDLTIQD